MGLVADYKVTLTFKNGTTLDLTASNYLMAYNVLFEMDSDAKVFAGSISANELTFGLQNKTGVFTPTNATSPYFGLLEEGIKVEAFDGVTRQGVFYVKDWNAPNTADKKIATVRCVDVLQSVLNSPVSLLEINTNITLKDYLLVLFKKVGFADADIVIDPSLTQVLNYTVASGAKLSDILADIQLSGDCNIYMSMDNKVIVSKKEVSGAVALTIDGSKNLTSAEPSKKMVSSANSLRLGFLSLEMGAVKALATIPAEVPAGNSKLDNNIIKDGNMFSVDSVKVQSSVGVEAELSGSTQNTASFDITNPSVDKAKCNITLYGRTINLSSSYVERKDDASITKNGKKEMKLESKLIQNIADANALADKLWSRINYDVPFLSVVTRNIGFLYKLGDICAVKSTALNLDTTGYIHTIQYEWRGGDTVRATLILKALKP